MDTKKGLTFNDITLVPYEFSMVRSRKDVNPTDNFFGMQRLPIISSNMDSVFSPKLAQEVVRNGGISVMHRFCSIDENIKMFKQTDQPNGVWGSVGIGKVELDRAIRLYNEGCKVLVLDVANAAAVHVVDQFKQLKDALPKARFVVGNFDSARQMHEFVFRSGGRVPDLFKVGIGPGSACITRTTTGVGTPSVTCLQNCVKSGYPVIFDGGIKNSGDFCKAIALGAKAVMMGRNFATCLESGAKQNNYDTFGNAIYTNQPIKKLYRGSASLSSYGTQGKTDYYRTPEGDEMWLTVTGTVEDLIKNFEGGLRSSMSYLGAFTLEEYKNNAKVLEVSTSSYIESGSFGKDLK